MKIVKTKDDIVGDMYCAATKENYEKLIKLGYDAWKCSNEYFYKLPRYELTDVIQLSTNYNTMHWYDEIDKRGTEFKFEDAQDDLSLHALGFLEPETFNVKIFSCYTSNDVKEYIGVVNGYLPAKWNSDGICLNPSKGYNLYREYKQVLYTKDNNPGFYPKQKFIVSRTELNSKHLEETGWRKATNAEIETFKY